MIAEEYLEVQVSTATPYRLHLMVVDGALRQARRGRQALEEQNLELAFQALSQSRDCVSELIGGLNPDEAPDLVSQVKGIFVFVYRNLALADFERSPQRVQDAIRVLELHRATWVALGEQLAPQGPGVPAPSPATRAAMGGVEAPSRSWVS